jgi:hypothetical protein
VVLLRLLLLRLQQPLARRLLLPRQQQPLLHLLFLAGDHALLWRQQHLQPQHQQGHPELRRLPLHRLLLWQPALIRQSLKK